MESILQQVKIGDIIPFGNYDWRVLDLQDDKVLILTENIIEMRKYDKDRKKNWEICDLRKYLNGEFLQKFSKEQQERIEETQIINKCNPWFGTNGGSNTNDKIFLLSIEEVVKYFGDSGQLINKNPNNENQIDDQYNSMRIAKYSNETGKWWLRLSGDNKCNSAYVDDNGSICVSGSAVSIVCIDCGFDWKNMDGRTINYDISGVRPALWFKL